MELRVSAMGRKLTLVLEASSLGNDHSARVDGPADCYPGNGNVFGARNAFHLQTCTVRSVVNLKVIGFQPLHQVRFRTATEALPEGHSRIRFAPSSIAQKRWTSVGGSDSDGKRYALPWNRNE